MTGKDTPEIEMTSNTAQTVIDLMANIGHAEFLLTGENDLTDPTKPKLASVPNHRIITDQSPAFVAAAELFQPLQRKGTAKLGDIDSLIAWTNLFKGDSSVLFAVTDRVNPSLTAVIDYHMPGAPTLTGERDALAQHCQHRGTFAFPMSNEWKAWQAVADRRLDKDDMGEFLEANAKDVMDPTPGILAGDPDKADLAEWETRLINVARRIEGRFGQLHELLMLSRHFKVFETSDLEDASNRDTGEQVINFKSEHVDERGAKIRVPNLFIIAIPVFEGGALYRMPVRFRYVKKGANLTFVLSPYDAEASFDAALRIEAHKARDETGLPLFMGRPETR